MRVAVRVHARLPVAGNDGRLQSILSTHTSVSSARLAPRVTAQATLRNSFISHTAIQIRLITPMHEQALLQLNSHGSTPYSSVTYELMNENE